MLEDDFIDDRQATQLVATHRREGDDAGPLAKRRDESQDMAKDAREYAALRREREEERTLTAQGVANAVRSPTKSSMTGRKVIRKRITKTFPDGRQTITFKFILDSEEVERIIRKKEESKIDEKAKRSTSKQAHKPNGRVFGHAMFEDDDNFELDRSPSRSNKVIRKRGPSHRGGPKPMRKELQLSKQKSRASAEKRMKKRKRELDEAELYVAPSKRKGTNNRRERGVARHRMPHVMMADKLESIRQQVEKRPRSGDFHRPVDRRLYPRYYEVISDPIDLQTIRDKNQKYEYKTGEAFLKDFNLMKNNAIKFNGESSWLALEAKKIYEFVKSTLDANKGELSSLEDAVRDQMSGKKKSKVSPKGKPSVSPTADVMVDGVALGDLSKFDDDTESDDSSTGLIPIK
uniref:Bromo domain-containing protein n=1 Tax=Cyclophora tenuis TaxID=216820 RepID=A0A7S1D8C8_CYCTE|mmetsp:Transcript_4016/g.6878  ORF Transcript_4016/g.6878 Transcript_4016/m.6878 type:complete len:404 (+) Transcript_4016:90-1301(+)